MEEEECSGLAGNINIGVREAKKEEIRMPQASGRNRDE